MVKEENRDLLVRLLPILTARCVRFDDSFHSTWPEALSDDASKREPHSRRLFSRASTRARIRMDQPDHDFARSPDLKWSHPLG
jgi:hypothetical protein